MPGDYTGLLALLVLSSVFAVLVIGVGALVGGPGAAPEMRTPSPKTAPAALEARLRLVRIGLLFACALPAVSLLLIWLGEARALGVQALPGLLGLGVPVLVGLGAAVARGALRW